MSGQRYTVNAMGEQCPIPVVKQKKFWTAFREMPRSKYWSIMKQRYRISPEWVKIQVQKCSPRKKSDKEFHVFIRVKDRQPVTDTKAEEVSCIPDAKGDFVVAVDTATMGRGNDELGKVLMKGFLFAVTQLDELPKTMLFYNGGATLTTEGSDSLEDLKSLEAQGVTIKTCGTCLNYYGLTEKLCVGEVTNMYDIVETMAKASKVIKP